MEPWEDELLWDDDFSDEEEDTEEQIEEADLEKMCIRDRLLTIPTFGDGVLSAVAGALRMLVSPDEFLRLGSRRCHIAVSYTHLDVYKRQDCR